MSDNDFEVVFHGRLVKGFLFEPVKENLIKLFKSTPQAIDQLFLGNDVTIKSNLDYAQAMKYQSALKKAGILTIINQKSDDQRPLNTQQTEPVSTQSPINSQPKETAEVVATTKATQQDQIQHNVQTTAEHLSLADPGARILPEKQFKPRQVNTEKLSLAAAGEKLLPDQPKPEIQPPDTSHLSIK